MFWCVAESPGVRDHNELDGDGAPVRGEFTARRQCVEAPEAFQWSRIG